MNTAAAAAEYAANIPHDFTLADVMGDEEYLDVEEEDVAERQRISAELARWFGVD